MLVCCLRAGFSIPPGGGSTQLVTVRMPALYIRSRIWKERLSVLKADHALVVNQPDVALEFSKLHLSCRYLYTEHHVNNRLSIDEIRPAKGSFQTTTVYSASVCAQLRLSLFISNRKSSRIFCWLCCCWDSSNSLKVWTRNSYSGGWCTETETGFWIFSFVPQDQGFVST